MDMLDILLPALLGGLSCFSYLYWWNNSEPSEDDKFRYIRGMDRKTLKELDEVMKVLHTMQRISPVIIKGIQKKLPHLEAHRVQHLLEILRDKHGFVRNEMFAFRWIDNPNMSDEKRREYEAEGWRMTALGKAFMDDKEKFQRKGWSARWKIRWMWIAGIMTAATFVMTFIQLVNGCEPKDQYDQDPGVRKVEREIDSLKKAHDSIYLEFEGVADSVTLRQQHLHDESPVIIRQRASGDSTKK